MSPLALPRYILDRKVDELTHNLPNGALKDVLLQLKNRPTFAEQWPTEYYSGLSKGKARILQLEKIRQAQLTMSDILHNDKEIYDWYNEIT
jgi:hypothetical protein